MKQLKSDNDLLLFNTVYNEYQGRFIRFASTYIDDRMAAEDIVMDAMMYYWENRNHIGRDVNVPAYIFASIKNKCLNYLRDNQYRQTASEQMREHQQWKLSLQIATLEACNPSELLSKEMHQLISDALSKLPETTRQIFIMRRFEEKSYREIASIMNLSVKGVEYHMAKAVETLKKLLKNYLPLLVYLLYR